MARVGISTTVDARLLAEARARTGGLADSALLDAALTKLVRSSRSTGVDAAYSAYDRQPLDEPDEWGDLSAFRQGAARS